MTDEGCLDDETLGALLEGRLDDVTREAVEVHVDTCADCLALVAAMARVLPQTHEFDEAPLSEDDPELRKGSRVGRYELLALVGIGGMGTVYSAHDTVLHRTVALKLVKQREGAEADAPGNLFGEARAMARLVHPNVVTIHDVGVYRGRVFLVMDLVEGETLGTWLSRERRTESEILAAFAAAGRGLAAAHRAGLVHRDFKPDNVLVGHDGHVRVTDFGLALVPSGAQVDAVLGTVAYMAPEQLRGGAVDGAADQFSLSVALYEALSGQRPFEGTRPLELLASISNGPSVDALRSPTHVRVAIRRGLQASPAKRFATMDDLVLALTWNPVEKQPRWPALLIAGLVLGVCITGLSVALRKGEASCRDSATVRLGSVWSDEDKVRIHDAFTATHRAHAEDTWQRVSRALDAHGGAWRAMAVDVCDATRVRAEASNELLELRALCLNDRLMELHELITVFEHADADVMNHALTATAGLTPLRRCNDALLLRAIPKPPRDIVELATTRQDLARVKALRDAGRVAESVRVGAEIAERATRIGYPPLEAEALLRLGDAQVAAGDGASATLSLEHAAEVADAARDDGTRARALTQRVFVEAYLLRHTSKIDELDGRAEAVVKRLGSDPDFEGDRMHALGMARYANDELAAAIAAFDKAVLLRVKAHGPKSRQVAMSVNSRCLVAQRAADLAFALTECERALAMWSDVLGPQHPEVALGMNNVGAVLERLGKHDAACQRFEDSLRIGEAALGGEHPQVAMTLGNLGECELARGHASLAVTIQTRVLRIREKLRDPRTSLTLNNLGRAYLGAGDTARAIEALEHAAALQTPETDLAERVETGFALAKAKWEQGDHRAARAQAITARTMLPEGLPEQRVIDDWLERHR